jgi:serine-type D-Ala-D-Ala carboxypeptidase (penicillin-binding protein 5/6)
MRQSVGLYPFALIALLIGLTITTHAEVKPAGLTCRAYLVFDIESQRITRSWNANAEQPIASVSKLMTAILAAERLRFDGRYVLTSQEQDKFGTESLRADKMLELMLVPSNNDVCRIVARIIAGSEPAFARLMNERSKEMGLAHTQFANATGLPGKGQYSTPRDVLKLFGNALRYPAIVTAMTKQQAELNGEAYDGTLLPLYQRHPGLLAGKTGYTKAAGRCMVLYYRTWPEPGKTRDYIVVLFGCQSVKASFRDAELLLSSSGLYSGEVGAWR